ncbi:MAG: flagellar biosynthesis anti-sigma factor FlgM [Acidobacteria bacterium]|nr:MAG: flagellar biosynthesis anti-sigma factor FlgM [Acidobacteriota bacterium]
MKIPGSDPLHRLRDLLDRLEGGRTAGRAGPGSSEGPAESGGADSVQLSERARELQRLRAALMETPDIRQELVDRLRDEIASGRYRIDGTRIADELLREADRLAVPADDGRGDA